MTFDIEILDLHVNDDQWWFGVLGFEYGDFDGHLFYIENDMGYWKFDLLFLRHLWLKINY